MSREYDHLNQYYCPRANEQGCVRSMCLRKRDNQCNEPGPYYECWDPETNIAMAPMVWNPVYNQGTNPPMLQPTCECPPSDGQNCGAVWWFVVILAGILVILFVLWALKKKKMDQATVIRCVTIPDEIAVVQSAYTV